jgi:hypothetical protein
VFTHCAGVIAHGRRLENLSWRTWGRDQTVLRQPGAQQAQLQFYNNNNGNTQSENETGAIESLDSLTSSSSAGTGSSSMTTRRIRYSSSSQRPSSRRLDSNASTASASGSGGSIPVSRSPPLGPLIKRVIFTPPDHGNDQLALYAASRTVDHGMYFVYPSIRFPFSFFSI